MQRKVQLYREGECNFSKLFDSYQGWKAYARWGHTYKLRESLKREIIDIVWDKMGK